MKGGLHGNSPHLPIAAKQKVVCGHARCADRGCESLKCHRVIFFTKNGKMVLLHGFIKKTQQIPQSDLDLADKCRREIIGHD